MASKKPGAPKGATTTAVANTAPAVVAQVKPAEVAQELPAETALVIQEGVTVETAVTSLGESADIDASHGADDSAASDALAALGFGGPLDGKQPEQPKQDWPRTYRATNNTRMRLSIPAHGLVVERFGAHTDIVIASEDALTGLKAEMGAIAFLNSFGDEDFKLEPVAGE